MPFLNVIRVPGDLFQRTAAVPKALTPIVFYFVDEMGRKLVLVDLVDQSMAISVYKSNLMFAIEKYDSLYSRISLNLPPYKTKDGIHFKDMCTRYDQNWPVRLLNTTPSSF